MFNRSLLGMRVQGRLRLAPLVQKRSFQKIIVKNPRGIRLLQISRGILKGIGIFYAGMGIVCGTGYSVFVYLTNQHQSIAKEWSYLSSYYARIGVYHQEVMEEGRDAEIDVEDFTSALSTIADEEDNKLNPKDEKEQYGKFKLLPSNKLKEKSKEWQSTYVDVVIRLAIAKAALGDIDNAYKLVMYSTGVPIDIGSHDMRSRSLRLLAKITSLKGESPEKSENYLIDAVRFNEIHRDNISFKGNGSLLLNSESVIGRETFESLVDLGVFYAKNDRSTKALELFLNLLQIIDAKHFEADDMKTCSDAPMLKNYIGEILYKKGLVSNSLQWAQEAYELAHVYSRSNIRAALIAQQALKNTVIINKKLGNDAKAHELQDVLDGYTIPFRNETNWTLFKGIFLRM